MIERIDADARRKVRTVSFTTKQGIRGVVTGLFVDHDPNCRQLRLYSAGCLHDIYNIPTDATITSIVPA